MTIYRVLVVDDEPLARRRLRQLISAAPDFDVVGECEDGRIVAEQVRTLRPDVVFLDVRMPHMDGFAVQQELRRARIQHVVFVTAHPEHAARAFDVEATDYLVKPVSQARFNNALDRVRRLGSDRSDRVLLGGRLGGAAVTIDDILWLEAEGAYVTVHTRAGRQVVRESLTQLIDRLGSARFLRIHRSAGINVRNLRALKRQPRGLTVVLSDGTHLPISRRNAAVVVALLRKSGVAL